MASQISKQLVQFEESFRQLEKEVKALEAENEDLKKKLAAAYAKIAQYEPEVVEVPGEPDPVPSDSGAPVAAAASAKSSKFKIVKDFLFTRSKPEDEKKAKAQKEAAAAAAAKSKKIQQIHQSFGQVFLHHLLLHLLLQEAARKEDCCASLIDGLLHVLWKVTRKEEFRIFLGVLLMPILLRLVECVMELLAFGICKVTVVAASLGTREERLSILLECIIMDKDVSL